MSSMVMVFTNAHNIPLYSTSLDTELGSSFAGTCIFLVFLASVLWCLFALELVLENEGLAC